MKMIHNLLQLCNLGAKENLSKHCKKKKKNNE